MRPAPRFRGAEKGDFRLLPESPCRNKGDELPDSPAEKKKPDLGAY